MQGKYATLYRILIGLLVSAGVGILVYVLYGQLIGEASKDASYYQTMRHAKDKDDFDYLLSTNAGRTGIDKASVKAVDPVSLPGLKAKYTRVERTKEEYTLHVETYTTTDSKGNTTTHTRTYWEWDVVGHEEKSAKHITINGIKTDTKSLAVRDRELKLTNKTADLRKIKQDGLFGIKITRTPKIGYGGRYLYTDSETRYSFDVVPVSYKTTLFARLQDNKVLPLAGDERIEQYTKSVKQVKQEKSAEVGSLTDWQLAGTLISVVVAGIIYTVVVYKLDNPY